MVAKLTTGTSVTVVNMATSMSVTIVIKGRVISHYRSEGSRRLRLPDFKTVGT
jgi:hypothetical protein